MYFLGVDGGSTKTEWALCDENGRVRAHLITEGCNYAFLKEDGFASLMRRAIDQLFSDAAIDKKELTAAMFSITVYGEVEETLTKIPAILRRLLPDCKEIVIENDSAAAWCGSLGHKAGINLVAGTGSVAYGRDEERNALRVGGWSLFFADEGSCSWVARQLISAFVKQSDGRAPRTPLYDELKNYLHIENDYFFSGYLQADVRTDSALLADMQRAALNAANKGDETAIQIYRDAAKELVLMADAIKRQLRFQETPIRVSYAGGLFRAGDLILQPFLQALSEGGYRYAAPIYPPVTGALLLAAENTLDEKTLLRMGEQITL